MKFEDIYLWALGVISALSFWFAITNIPESMLNSLRTSGL